MKKNMEHVLQNTFWLESFREGQEEIISSIVEWNDTLVFMPTGWWKSLTYQLPGIVREGITIVVSPLISLMKDQVDALRELWVRAELINSTLSWAERAEIMHELRYYDSSDEQAVKFLYIAPERLNSNEFIWILKTTKIALIAIDEAHCISQWGHDFRPSYMKIKGFIESLRDAEHFPVVGLTATATPKVRIDIVERLGLLKYQSFITGFDRKNIILVVREISEKSEKQAKALEIINKTPWTGIIYCSSRKHVIELSDYVISKWVKTWVYKWDLSPEVREAEQNKFMNDQYKVMVATNAFGMWIDKKDIRFVLHYNLPGSIENYYQEVGRAGRDGKMSYGIVLASYGDTKIQEFFIDNTYPEKKQVLDFYDYLYKDFKLWEWKAARVAKTYYVMASESGVGNDMIVWSIIKILEKYNILRRGLEASDSESDFRGRWLTLLQEKRQHSHVLIDWKRQDLLKDESYFKLEQIKRLLFYPWCRKKFILEYFWDEEDLKNLKANCGLCDYCLESWSVSEDDKKKFLPASSYGIVLETVKKYNEKFGISLLVKVLNGSHEARISQWHLDDYDHYGVFSDMTLEMVTALFEALMMEDFLFKTDGKYPCVWVTEYGSAALYKNVHITQNIVDLNSYVMQKVKNTSKKSWSKSSSKSTWRKTPKGQTYKDTLELFKQGISLKDISTQRELWLQTIEGHIAHLYLQGDITLMQVMNMIQLSKAKSVKSVIEQDAILENIELKSIRQKLEEEWKKDVSYFEIKLSLAMIEKWDL
jgi:ATP-dependent DNA helicase RecQ